MLGEAVVRQHMLQPIAASGADGGDQDAPPGRPFFVDALADRVVEIDVRPGPRLAEVPDPPGAGVRLLAR